MKQIHGGDWAGFQTEYGFLPLDFSANLSPLGLPEGVSAAAAAAIGDAGRYPDPLCRALRKKLSAVHGVPMEQIVCGNGAADLIWRLAAALRPKQAAVPAPGFAEYERALAAAGCTVKRLHLRQEDDFALTEEFLAAITPELELLFLCNPNNPTGRLARSELLSAAAQACRECGTLLVVDECFLEFTPEPSRHTLIHLLGDMPGLVILRAFTKTYAMAGLRLGYALCGSAALAEKLRDGGQPWPVSTVAQAAGLATLDEKEYLERLRALVAAERPKLAEGLAALGLRVIPGEANFLLFYSGDPQLCEKLRPRGILLRDCSAFPGLCPGWYRAAVRTGEENDALLRAMREVLADG